MKRNKQKHALLKEIGSISDRQHFTQLFTMCSLGIEKNQAATALLQSKSNNQQMRTLIGKQQIANTSDKSKEERGKWKDACVLAITITRGHLFHMTAF